MSEASAQHELILTPFDTRPVGAAILQADRQFSVALVVATVLHVLFFASFISAGVRHLGDPSGAADGISVDIVTEADLKRLGTVGDQAAGAPTPAPPAKSETAAQPPPEPPKPPEPQEQAKAEPTPPERQAQPAPEPPSPSPSPPEPQAQPKAVPPDPALKQLLKIPAQAALPHSLDPPKPPEPAKPAKPEDAKEHQPKERRQRTAALDLRMPPSFFAAPSGGGGAGVQRPPGTTRSGENDAFARGVIAALQRTMPQLGDTKGRVTVRIILDLNGSIVRTEVIRPSDIAGLDRSVVFATRQASFPFPPRNANSADLTFLVTYIYR